MCNVIWMGWGVLGEISRYGVGLSGLVCVVIMPYYNLILFLCLGYSLSYIIHLFFMLISIVICNIIGYLARFFTGPCFGC
jgi:hypothetical protein